MKPPIRIKLYGLVSVTRRGYIAQLLVGVVVIAVALAAWMCLPPLDRPRLSRPGPVPPPPDLPPAATWILWAMYHLHWFLLVASVALAVEAFFVLRRFAREEARQRAESEKTPPSP